MRVEGSLVALITPFLHDRIDFKALQGLVAWHAQEGTSALVVLGSTGEAGLVRPEERREIIKVVLDAAHAQPCSLPIIIGCSAASTESAIALVQQAEAAGADAAMVQAPYYVRPSQAGIIAHFCAIGANSRLPLIAYNHPGRVGVAIEELTIQSIADQVPSLVALKDSSPDLARALRLSISLPESVALLCGDDSLNMAYLAHGARGIISVTANICPAQCNAFTSAWAANKGHEAAALHRRLMPLHQAMVCAPNPCPAKYALAHVGKIQNILRLPLLPIDPASPQADLIQKAMTQVG